MIFIIGFLTGWIVVDLYGFGLDFRERGNFYYWLVTGKFRDL